MSSSKQIMKIQSRSIQNKCLRCVQKDNSCFLTVRNIINLEVLKFDWKVINNALPVSLQKYALTNAYGTNLEKNHRYNTRNKIIPNVLMVLNKQYKSSIFCKGITHLIDLPADIHSLKTYTTYCKTLKTHLKFHNLNSNIVLVQCVLLSIIYT